MEKYCVVEVENGKTLVIPKFWLCIHSLEDDDSTETTSDLSSCHYPDHLSAEKLETAIAKVYVPRGNWKQFKVISILATKSKYKILS